MSLNVLVVPLDPYSHVERTRKSVEVAMVSLLSADDTWTIGSVSDITDTRGWDLLIAWEPCGWSAIAEPAAKSMIPCLTLSPPLTFHTYHAALSKEIQARGGILLGSTGPDEIASSIAAVRARQSLRSTRLVVVNNHESDARADIVKAFKSAAFDRLGVSIVRRSAAELIKMAAAQSSQAVAMEWQRWLAEVLDGPGEMDEAHMHQVVRLYLAERQMLAEEQAQGITVDDIGAFLTVPDRKIMPNSSYGPLTMDGFLCCEEGDIEALTTQAILKAGLDTHPTMSNIYMAYRDALEAKVPGTFYTPEMERQDFEQCVRDNHLVAAHFSTSGVLPPNMMVEERYRVRQTLPAWPGQSMTASTPKAGPVVLARLSADVSGVHLVSGMVDQVSMDDRLGWYRGRWMIAIPSASSFMKHCLHQHYVIAPENEQSRTLTTLVRDLLRLAVFDDDNFRGGRA